MAHLKGEAKTRYVAGLFARISRRYDFMNTVMTAGGHHRWRKQAVGMAASGLTGLALDVATGTGDLALALAKMPGIQHVIGLDIVPEMVAVARLKAQRRGLTRRVTFVEANALAMPFPDNTFVCATSGFSMRNVADVPAALAEMARVVRPGGRMSVLEITPFRPKGLLSWLLRVYFRRIVPVLGGLLAGDREAYTYLPSSVELFMQPPELAALMEQAGLRNVRFTKVGMGAVAIHVGEKG